MADTVRTLSALQVLLADNSTRSISPQDVRDALYSTLGVVPYVAKTAHYTATANDEFIGCDATSGAITITLPAVASTRVGKRFTVKKTDAGVNAVTLDGNASETIENATTLVLAAQYDVATIVNTGAAWLVESKVIA